MSPQITPPTFHWPTILLAFAAGTLAATVMLVAVPGLDVGPDMQSPDPDNPPMSTTTVGPSCYDGANPNAGWVHESGLENAHVLTLNATVVHDAGTEVVPTVYRFGEANYGIAFETERTTEQKESNCDRVETRFEMGVTLPASYDRFVVEEGGETLLEAERGTTADLYLLPNPVIASS